MKPKVSIIVNNYNYSRYLAESIDSALAQAAPSIELEVVVVDDGSTDDSLKVLRAFGDQIKLISQLNQGQVVALNTGAANASGDILVFLDSDDRLLNEKASQIVRIAGSKLLGKTPVAIFDWYERIDADGARFRIRWPKAAFRKAKQLFSLPQSGLRRLTNPKKVIRNICSFGYSPKPYVEGTSRITINRAAADAAFPLDPAGIKICADALLVRVCSLYADFYELNVALTEYRLHGKNNWSSDAPRSPVDIEAAVTQNVNKNLESLELDCKWLRNDECPSTEFMEAHGYKAFIARLSRSDASGFFKLSHFLYILRMDLSRKFSRRIGA